MPCPGKIAASARSFPLSSAKQRVDRRPEVGSSAEMVMIAAGDDVQRHLSAPAGCQALRVRWWDPVVAFACHHQERRMDLARASQ